METTIKETATTPELEESAERILSEGRVRPTAEAGEYFVAAPDEEQPRRHGLRMRPLPTAGATVSLQHGACTCGKNECEHQEAVMRYVRQALGMDSAAA